MIGLHKSFAAMATSSAAVAFLALAAAPSARADAIADFYKSHPVQVVIGYTTGGAYDLYARVLSRYYGKYLPGNPTLVPQNMPGAGSLKAANYIYAVAPKDGSVFGTFGRGEAVEPLIGDSGATFDSRKFTWLGSITSEVSICATWNTSKVKTWDDALKHEFTVGGEGSGSDPDIFAAVMKNVFGAKLKLVTGYPGGNEINLAMERGEVDGRCGWSWSSVMSTKPDWIKNKKVNVFIQMAMKKDKDIDAPLIMDLAKDDHQRKILTLFFSRQEMGRPFAAPPGIPADRKAALIKAFNETMKDPSFLADTKKQKLDVDPVDAKDLAKLVDDIYATPKEILAEGKSIVAKGAR